MTTVFTPEAVWVSLLGSTTSGKSQLFHRLFAQTRDADEALFQDELFRFVGREERLRIKFLRDLRKSELEFARSSEAFTIVGNNLFCDAAPIPHHYWVGHSAIGNYFNRFRFPNFHPTRLTGRISPEIQVDVFRKRGKPVEIAFFYRVFESAAFALPKAGFIRDARPVYQCTRKALIDVLRSRVAIKRKGTCRSATRSGCQTISTWLSPIFDTDQTPHPFPNFSVTTSGRDIVNPAPFSKAPIRQAPRRWRSSRNSTAPAHA